MTEWCSRMADRKIKHFGERETVWMRWRMIRTTGQMTSFLVRDVFGFGALVYPESLGLDHRALV